MEIIFEALYELFIEGLVGATKIKKVPIIVRLLIASVLSGLLITIAILVSISALNATGILGAIICWIISFGLVGLWLLWCIKIIKSK
ncbi:MAG TPA: hypothetical protein VJX95_05980 [Oscillospiraceae bacterium]|nr:hypothetical protein [Oscillospiraceae bacterium]